MSNDQVEIFYLLVDENGDPFRSCGVDSVSVSPSANLIRFRDAVKDKNDNKLAHVDSSDLRVFKNEAAFRAKPPTPLVVRSIMANVVDSSDTCWVMVAVPPAGIEISQPDMESIQQAVEAALVKHEACKRTACSFSAITSQKLRLVMNTARISSATIPSKPSSVVLQSIPGYSWMDMNEDHKAQRASYMAYLLQHIGDVIPKDMVVLDVAAEKTLLSIDDLRLPLKLSGGTDAIIVEKSAIESLSPMDGLHVIIELKKQVTKEHISQACMELIAADLLATNTVTLLLTDLNEKWIFAWIEDRQIVKTTFKEPASAIQFIQEVLAIGKRDDLPVPSIGRPLKRARLANCLPIPDDVPMDAIEDLERYQLLDDVEPEVMYKKKLRALSQVFQFNHHLPFGEEKFQSMFA